MKLKEAMSIQEPEPVWSRSIVPSSSQPSLWQAFEIEVSKKTSGVISVGDKASQKITNYWAATNVKFSESPLCWWQVDGQQNFPVLHKVAAKYLSVPGMSIFTEQVFSTAGGIILKKRSSLTDENAAMLIFLKENLEL